MTLVLSLFPGIGLLDHAFEAEGYCVVRGPDVLWGGDVRLFRPPAGVFAGVIGGPPCQSFSSLANLVRARGYEPRFGNLIPEFERVVAEAGPAWFLMEEVPAAPPAQVAGYEVLDFLLEHSSLDGGDGYGLEQERLRRFSFGVRGGPAYDLRRHIQLAALRLPRAARAGTITQWSPDNSAQAKGRVRTPAVLSSTEAVPVALGGSGKRKPVVAGAAARQQRARTHAVTGSDGGNCRVAAVVGCHSGANRRPKGGHLKRYKLPEALRLQGLPEDYLRHHPFTAEGALKAVANGVPIPMGRALARAVRAWLNAQVAQEAAG